MIAVEVTPEMRNRAFDLSNELGSLNNSIRGGEGNLIGFLGELAVAEYLDAELDHTYDYDLSKCCVHIDVKSKECKSKPMEYFECSVAEYNTRQKCDVYVFARVWKNLRKVWIVGWEFKEDYYENAHFLRKGEMVDNNDFEVKANCYNLSIENLRPIEELKDALENWDE